MKNFDELVEIVDHLLAPEGCPWDREQTLTSMRSSLLEETSETIEAINLNRNEKIEEELGDLFFNVVFLCKLAEKENRFTVEKVLKNISAKLIRRHPHVFERKAHLKTEEVVEQWDKIKQSEKPALNRFAFSHIPKELSTLARAQKIVKRLQKIHYPLEKEASIKELPTDEKKLGAYLFNLIRLIQNRGGDAEQALRHYLTDLEVEVEAWKQVNLQDS